MTSTHNSCNLNERVYDVNADCICKLIRTSKSFLSFLLSSNEVQSVLGFKKKALMKLYKYKTENTNIFYIF